ncbi:unnamed protein product [Cyclocybe aegerita]|uniref:Cytochrome P450 n=1 Tax=Cyclocybe aegerita TaxID=1973307 RepID=A0A8S0VRD1_CYCAE|nr:unnamed protein product [Cyclocybe aegerita]
MGFNAACFVFGGLLYFLLHGINQRFIRRRRQGPYPPGPKGWPIIGNWYDVPIEQPGRTYLDWGKPYNSDMVHTEVFGQHTVVVNSREIADELLEKRARNTSGRQYMPITHLLDWDYNIALMSYSDEWRKHRKACQQHLNRDAARLFQPIQIQKTHEMLLGLLHSPENFEAHSRVLSLAITMDMMYGYQLKTLEDPVVSAAERALEIGNPLYSITGSLRTALESAQWTAQMKRIPLDDINRRMAEGSVTPSLLTQFLEKKATIGASAEEEKIMKNVAYTVYGAASDTTISATGTFFYAMAISPDVQKKAQAEIDRVVGTNRLPDFTDRPSLPYIEAIYREVMRFCPPLPIGLMHTLAEDDVCGGYFIPKGTQVFPNIWAITHDPNTYKDPHIFQPERFFNEDGTLNDDHRVLAYGYGRRVCVGKYVASSTMWITIVSVLACYNIGKAKDEHGNEIEINDEYVDSGLIQFKKPFKCSITPRSSLSRKLIEEALSEYK